MQISIFCPMGAQVSRGVAAPALAQVQNPLAT